MKTTRYRKLRRRISYAIYRPVRESEANAKRRRRWAAELLEGFENHFDQLP